MYIMKDVDAKKKNIVILGAGFGGITAALSLAKQKKQLSGECDIILIDRRHHQLYTPTLYEIAAIPMENASDGALKTSILIPIADIIEKKAITFICDEFISIDTVKQEIILQKNGMMPYEFFVFALGSETNYFDIPGLKERSFPLKTFDDAARLRSAIEELIRKKDALKIVVGGAGSSGVELVAEFSNFICDIKEKIAPERKTCNTELLLVEASPEILPGFDNWTIKKAKRRLARIGVRIKTSAAITAVDTETITFKNGEKETYDIISWTGGVKGPAIFANLGFSLSPKGTVEIDEFLRVNPVRNDYNLNPAFSKKTNLPTDVPQPNGVEISNGIKNTNSRIFAIGDNASFINPKTGKPLVWNAPVAEAEGRLVAKNIIRTIRKEPLLRFIPLKKYPFILAIGRKYAIADLVIIHICGFLGWALKQIAELRYLLFILPIKKAMPTWLRGEKYFMSND